MGARPISSSAVRFKPNTCTSSAPKVEMPTSGPRPAGLDGLDLLQLLGPVVKLPVVPVESEAVNRDRIDLGQHALAGHVLDEQGINRRDAAQGLDQLGMVGRDCLARQNGHPGESRPSGSSSNPSATCCGFVEHHGFDHRSLPRAG